MTLAVDRAAVPPRAEGPERRGGAGEVQTDVPERIYRRGDPAGRAAGRQQRYGHVKTTCFFFFFTPVSVVMKE